MKLSKAQNALLNDTGTPARAMAMRIVSETARMLGARSLIAISSAHIDGCLYHGPGGMHFAETLASLGGKVAVPATLNVGALDLANPAIIRSSAETRQMAKRQMDAYLALGCQPSWTCAPYQAGHRPAFGAHVAWGESNAVAFANSVLGARTERYGDLIDIACALAGHAPCFGLHLEENRKATMVFDVSGLSRSLRLLDGFYPVLGAIIGRETARAGEAGEAGNAVPAITGLEDLADEIDEDRLKALGAAAAASGAVGLFHAVGVTPEAPSLDAACGGARPARRMDVTTAMARAARDGLSGASAGALDCIALDCVALGSPHFSHDEAMALLAASDGLTFKVPFYVCTRRDVLDALTAEGHGHALRARGVRFVADTCVMVTPILAGATGTMMTNSAKFAHYARPHTGYSPVFGTLRDCVLSAASGRIIRDEEQWA